MLSLEKCRAALEARHGLSNEALERLRADMYVLAEILAAQFRSSRGTRRPSLFDEALALLAEPEREHALERAAVHEFDGGLPRSEAERLATSAAIAHMSPGRRSSTRSR